MLDTLGTEHIFWTCRRLSVCADILDALSTASKKVNVHVSAAKCTHTQPGRKHFGHVLQGVYKCYEKENVESIEHLSRTEKFTSAP